MTPKKHGKTVKMAKRLRREMSPPEIFLWQHLRGQDIVKIRRDRPFGPYALDFFCAKAKLAIEIDGMSHDMGDHPERDSARDAYVLANGVETIRIPAAEVLRDSQAVADAVIRMCLARIEKVSAPPSRLRFATTRHLPISSKWGG